MKWVNGIVTDTNGNKHTVSFPERPIAVGNGKDGVTPSIKIGTVTTLDASSNATVTRRGTDAEPVFDFGIPRGLRGPQGEPGSGSNMYITPEQYGAKGNGIDDDTEAIQNAVNASAEQHKKLVFFAKTYIVSSTIVLPADGAEYGMHIEGYNSSQTIIRAVGNIVAFSADRFKRCSIRHLCIKFDDNCPSGAIGIKLGTDKHSNNKCFMSIVDDVIVSNGSGFEIWNSTYMRLENCAAYFGANQFGLSVSGEYFYANNCYLSGEREDISGNNSGAIGTGKCIWLRSTNQTYISQCDCCASRGYGVYFDGNNQQINTYIKDTTFFGDFVSVYIDVRNGADGVVLSNCDAWASRTVGAICLFDLSSGDGVKSVKHFNADFTVRDGYHLAVNAFDIGETLGAYTDLSKIVQQIDITVKTASTTSVVPYDRRLLVKIDPCPIYYAPVNLAADTVTVFTYYGLFPKRWGETMYPGFSVQADKSKGTEPEDVKYYWEESDGKTLLRATSAKSATYSVAVIIDWDTLGLAGHTLPESQAVGSAQSSLTTYSIGASATKDNIPLSSGMRILCWPSNTGSVDFYFAGSTTKHTVSFNSASKAVELIWIASTATAGSVINLIDGSRTYITFSGSSNKNVFKVVNGIAGNIVVATIASGSIASSGSQSGNVSVVVDDTLSISGAAADAKATGDALNVLGNAFRNWFDQAVTLLGLNDLPSGSALLGGDDNGV